MRTTDLFKNNRAPKKLNETIEKTFGRKLNLEAFNIEQLEDARNKLRTQIHTARTESGFNETIENDALTQAQWMHDAIVAELMDRNEHIVDNTEVAEGGRDWLQRIIDNNKEAVDHFAAGGDLDYDLETDLHHYYYDRLSGRAQRDADDDGEIGQLFADDLRDMGLMDDEYDQDDPKHPGFGEREAERVDIARDTARDNAGDGDFDQNESAPQGWEGTVKAMKKHKEIDNPYALAHSMKNKGYTSHKKESVETGDDMTKLHEGEIQQASAIVTAKTMVDRVGRWIEELSGMENDTLLQLGDSIRDEMSQDLAKNFISTVAPAIQQALQNLKDTRETLASGVRTLTGEEQPAEMLGGDGGMGGGAPEGDLMGPEGGEAGPDTMNADEPIDDFAAAEPAVGGDAAAGREMRESIHRENSLLKALAG
jgi:hypothetical protein